MEKAIVDGGIQKFDIKDQCIPAAPDGLFGFLEEVEAES
jgi:hypothetical protein